VRQSGSQTASTLVQVDNAWVARVPGASANGTADVAALFAGQTSVPPLAMTVLSAGVRVQTLDSVVLDAGATLTGVALVGSSLTRVGVTLSDGRRYDTLFEGPTPNVVLPGLISFSSESAAVAVDAATGRVTLLANSPALVTVRANVTSLNLVRPSAAFACNLAPAVGDVDIGVEYGGRAGEQRGAVLGRF
jgi:hypothetical protein